MFFKSHRDELKEIQIEEKKEAWELEKQKTKDMLCMGVSKKLAKGPNPLSVRKKVIKKNKPPKVKKRRLRKGKRSKELSATK